MQEEEIRKILEEQNHSLKKHSAVFLEFHSDWKEHRAEARVAMERVASLHNDNKTIVQNLSHLSQLPLIASAISSHQITTNQLIQNIAETERNFSKTFMRVLVIILVMVASFAICFILIFVKDVERDVKINMDGITISKPANEDPKIEIPIDIKKNSNVK